jgi:hypothetical protein
MRGATLAIPLLGALREFISGRYHNLGMSKPQAIALSIFGVLLVLCGGAYLWDQSQLTSIQAILAQPQVFAGRVVTISGSTEHRSDIPFTSYHVFSLVQDGARLTVVAKDSAPVDGQRIRVTGTAKSAEVFGVLRLGPVVLEERRSRSIFPSM